MIIIGHRGARGLAPENTLAGFKKALELGVGEIEFDVRVSKDGVAVLHHDKILRDSSRNTLKISEHDFQELRQHKPDLTTLQEALNFIAGSVTLYIEIKKQVLLKPIVGVLANYKHAYTLGSKSQKTLRELHKALPNAPKRVIEPWSGIRATWRARQLKTNLLAMNQLFLWTGFIKAMKNSGYELYAYTLNDPSKARRWSDHGLAGVITDFPDRFA